MRRCWRRSYSCNFRLRDLFGLDIIVLAASGVLFWLAGRTGYQIVLAPEVIPTISGSY